MDFSAALIFSCLLVAQAACGVIPNKIKNEALNETIQLLRREGLQTVLEKLNAPELFGDRPCLNLNSTELGEPEEQSLSAYHLSFFRCYILKVSQLSQMSDLTTALPLQLKRISHHINSMEVLIDDSSASQDCSLPAFEDMDLFLYVKCLLQRLDQRLSNVKF